MEGSSRKRPAGGGAEFFPKKRKVEPVDNVNMNQLCTLMKHARKVVQKAPDFALNMLTQNGEMCIAMLHAEQMLGILPKMSFLPLTNEEVEQCRVKSKEIHEKLAKYKVAENSQVNNLDILKGRQGAQGRVGNFPNMPRVGNLNFGNSSNRNMSDGYRGDATYGGSNNMGSDPENFSGGNFSNEGGNFGGNNNFGTFASNNSVIGGNVNNLGGSGTTVNSRTAAYFARARMLNPPVASGKGNTNTRPLGSFGRSQAMRAGNNFINQPPTVGSTFVNNPPTINNPPTTGFGPSNVSRNSSFPFNQGAASNMSGGNDNFGNMNSAANQGPRITPEQKQKLLEKISRLTPEQFQKLPQEVQNQARLYLAKLDQSN